MLLPLANQFQEERANRIERAPLAAPAILRFWHLASFDAPSVAVVWALGFAWAVGVRLPGWAPALIALTTWAVYVADRLLDARSALRSGDDAGLRERHFFHWRNRRILTPLGVAAAAGAASLIAMQMPVAARERDSVLAAAALVYFSGVHGADRLPRWIRQVGSKELAVGVLFTTGCALPALSRIHGAPGFFWAIAPMVMLAAFFAGLAWLNCSAIDCWESGREGVVSAAGCTLAAIGLFLAVCLFQHFERISALSLAGALSACVICLLHRWRNRLSPLALRCAADLALLTPILCLTR